MPVSIGLGIADVVGGIIGGIGEAAAAIAPEAAAAGIGAEAGAVALPEIAVTAAAPEAAAFGGADLLAGGALAGTAADLTGGIATGADIFGATTGADLAGGALAGATPIATEGVTSIAPTVGAALGGGGGLATAGDVLAGTTTGPLAALDTSPIASDFATLSQAGIGPSVDISGGLGDVASPIASDFSAVTSGLPDVSSFAPTTTDFGTATDPFANISTGTDAFANAPAAVPGQSDLGTAQLAAGVGPDPGVQTLPPSAQSALASEGIGTAPIAPTPPAGIPPAPTIAASEPTATLASTTAPGTPGAGVAPDVAASQAVGPTAAPASLTGANVSPGVAGLLSGSNLRTAAMLAPVGLLGYTLARGPQPLPPAEQQALSNANVVGGFGSSQLQMGRQNQITPAQQQQIDTFVQQETDRVYQLYANQGGDPTKNTGYLQAVKNIQAQGLTMRQQFVNAEIQNGIQAMGIADATLTQAANMQVANDNAFNNSIAGATSALAFTLALGSKAA